MCFEGSENEDGCEGSENEDGCEGSENEDGCEGNENEDGCEGSENEDGRLVSPECVPTLILFSLNWFWLKLVKII